MSKLNESALEAKDLHVAYEKHPVLHGINCSIPREELTVILGPNACGKSTLLKIFARIHQPTAGEIYLQGQKITDLSNRSIAQTLALLPQSPHAPDSVTVADVVALGRYPYQGFLGRMRREDHRICQEAMDACGIADLKDRTLQELSGGQRQRVWIAMTLAQDTPLLLLDEPTTYLDITHQLQVLDLAAELHRQGKTLLLVLHDLNLAFRYATHLILMKAGTIMAEGPPQEIVTPQIIEQVFDIKASIITDPHSHTPLMIPHDTRNP
ncbi:ABC transporter ATP-binding protein [Rothia nasimurium]|uniref:ABC transporter ATP-binding protein n=1 Tax=Rothia nasimurium TaxID=85336 RepID=UPI001F45F31F|nr:ABC transporter ATP-binding protein [Rothia nasimurium]